MFMAVELYTNHTQIKSNFVSYIHPMTVQENLMIVQMNLTLKIMIELSMMSVAFQRSITWAWVI